VVKTFLKLTKFTLEELFIAERRDISMKKKFGRQKALFTLKRMLQFMGRFFVQNHVKMAAQNGPIFIELHAGRG
jgi:hypothetical protein